MSLSASVSLFCGSVCVCVSDGDQTRQGSVCLLPLLTDSLSLSLSFFFSFPFSGWLAGWLAALPARWVRVALALARWPVGWLRVFPPAGPPARRFSVSTAPSPRPSDPLAPAFASDRAEQLSQLGPRSIPQRPAINMQFVTTVRYAKKSRWAQLETAYIPASSWIKSLPLIF